VKNVIVIIFHCGVCNIATITDLGYGKPHEQVDVQYVCVVKSVKLS